MKVLRDAVCDHYRSMDEELPADPFSCPITFGLFLHLMRRYADVHEGEAAEKEARALSRLEPRFSAEELAEFRSIFKLYDREECGELRTEPLTGMLRSLRLHLNHE